MNTIFQIDGIRLASLIKPNHKQKLLLIEVAENSSIFAAFTQNIAKAAPVIVASENLTDIESNQKNAQKTPRRALIINSGNANAATGKDGIKVCQQSCEIVANHLNIISPKLVLPFSTGVIGKLLDINLFKNGIKELTSQLSCDSKSWILAAKSIMTTDTKEKVVSKKITFSSGNVHITGIAKGSGMICPNMATMLAFVATDIKLEKNLMRKIFNQAIKKSFNRISVDGDTSTNDSVVLITTEKRKIKPNEIKKFKKTLNYVFRELAKMIIEDGEGATKLITIKVEKASSKKMALRICYDIAHSPLVKTAFFAEDANWGRIIAAIGKPNIVNSKPKGIDINSLELFINGIEVFKFGKIAKQYDEARLTQSMKNHKIEIKVILNNGNKKEQILSNDLSYDYVKINSDYRS